MCTIYTFLKNLCLLSFLDLRVKRSLEFLSNSLDPSVIPRQLARDEQNWTWPRTPHSESSALLQNLITSVIYVGYVYLGVVRSGSYERKEQKKKNLFIRNEKENFELEKKVQFRVPNALRP